MGGQPNGSSAPFPRLRWVNRRGRCASSQVSHFTLGTFSANGLRTPPSLGRTMAVPVPCRLLPHLLRGLRLVTALMPLPL